MKKIVLVIGVMVIAVSCKVKDHKCKCVESYYSLESSWTNITDTTFEKSEKEIAESLCDERDIAPQVIYTEVYIKECSLAK